MIVLDFHALKSFNLILCLDSCALLKTHGVKFWSGYIISCERECDGIT